jgi:hypothetical protein
LPIFLLLFFRLFVDFIDDLDAVEVVVDEVNQ